MSERTKIEWTDATWNPVTGCTPISEGCDNCYAEAMAHRFGRSFEVTCHPDRLEIPLRWRKPRMVFVCSVADLFHDGVPDDFIAAVFGIMVSTPKQTYQVLTKRPERMREWLTRITEKHGVSAREYCFYAARDRVGERMMAGRSPWGEEWPLTNVWLGTTMESQPRVDERFNELMQTPAAVRFVSVEPMLGSVTLPRQVAAHDQGRPIYTSPLDWVICGGETGPHARPMDPDWARSLRDECQEAGVPYFFKKLGHRKPTPDDLQIQEWP